MRFLSASAVFKPNIHKQLEVSYPLHSSKRKNLKRLGMPVVLSVHCVQYEALQYRSMGFALLQGILTHPQQVRTLIYFVML